MKSSFLELLVAAIHIHLATAIVGYDCSGQSLNVTSFSLLDVGECKIPNLDPVREQKYVQLMQLSDYDNTAVIQCKVEIDRTIYYCGMQSHISVVHNGRRQYLLDVTPQLCKQLHISGILTLGSSIQITDLKRNSTDSRSVTLAGSIGVNGACKGTQYSDPFGTWDNVVVQAVIKITLQNYQASIRTTSNQVMLRSGVHCPIQNEACVDTDGGNTFWTTIPDSSCAFNKYDILYEGLATKLKPRDTMDGPTVYTVTTQDTTFALTLTTDFTLCGYTIQKTEHPKLFILETSKDQTFKIKGKISVDNLDIFSYVNSKFIYVEKHIRTQMNRLYHDIIQQKCALEKQVLKNALALATLAPDEVAFSIMKGPGYMSTVAGEVIYIVKCVPIEAKLRRTEECYREMPVTYQNTSLFLTPKTRFLTKHAATTTCSELLPTMYSVHGTWYKLTPKPVESTPPPVIEPLSQPKWRYISPKHLATSGIYSDNELDNLRDHLMFPVEKPAMLNTLARGAMGQSIPKDSISMFNLLDEKSLEKIATSTSERIWSWFVTFGSTSAGIIGIYVAIRTIKIIIDTIIHGYTLHSIYGWSIRLLGALWSSMTHLLVQLGTRPTPITVPVASVEEGKANIPQQQASTSSDEDPAERAIPVQQKSDEFSYADLSSRLTNMYP